MNDFVPINGGVEKDEWVTVREFTVELVHPVEGSFLTPGVVQRRVVKRVIGYEERVVQKVHYAQG